MIECYLFGRENVQDFPSEKRGKRHSDCFSAERKESGVGGLTVNCNIGVNDNAFKVFKLFKLP